MVAIHDASMIWRMAARARSAVRSMSPMHGGGRSIASRRVCCSTASLRCCGVSLGVLVPRNNQISPPFRLTISRFLIRWICNRQIAGSAASSADHSGPSVVRATDEPGATMKEHRSTAVTVPNNPQFDNMSAIDALESLRAAILQVDTLAQVASNAVDQLRCPSGAASRREFARMQILVGKVADEASAALARSDDVIAAVARQVT